MFKIAHALMLTIVLMPGWVRAELPLNGLSLHSELNQELFIGAYYTDLLTADANNQFDHSRKRRLEMRITTRLFSARRSTSLWIEGISINTPPELLTQQAEKITQFAQLINHTLRAGDQLVIESRDDDIDVKINGLLLGSVTSPELFNMLLSSWIGAVPLSSTFRDELLSEGQIDPALLARFDNLKPAASRRDIATRWQQKNTAPQQPQRPPAMEFTATHIDQPVLNPATLNIPAAPQVKANAGELQHPTATINPDPTPETMTPESIAPEESDRDQSENHTESHVATAPANAEPEGDDDEELDLSEINVAFLLSRKLFHTEIIKNVYRYIRYPNKAIAKGHEGTVQVELVIDRQGKVVRATEVEASRYDSLNRAAMKAIYKAQPYPQPPAEIPGESLAFRLPITFRIPQ